MLRNIRSAAENREGVKGLLLKCRKLVYMRFFLLPFCLTFSFVENATLICSHSFF